LDAVALLPVDRAILAAAGALDEPVLRALDAIHLAAAIDLSPIDAFVSYDERQSAAARLAGLRAPLTRAQTRSKGIIIRVSRESLLRHCRSRLTKRFLAHHGRAIGARVRVRWRVAPSLLRTFVGRAPSVPLGVRRRGARWIRRRAAALR
jgi:hypothetical protein